MDKCTTIVSNSNSNFSRNPLLSLFFGKSYSRILLHFPLDYIRKFVLDKTYPDLCKLRHTLHLFNASHLDFRSMVSPCPTIDLQSAQRATNFTLILFKIPTYFGDGMGYDPDNVSYISSTSCGVRLFDQHSSCSGATWYNSHTNWQWGSGLLGHYNHLIFKPEREYYRLEEENSDNLNLIKLQHIYDQYGNMVYPIEEAFPYEGVSKGIYSEKFLEEQFIRFKNKQSSIILDAKYFDLANQNIVWDVTETVNDWLIRENERNLINHGLCICFAPEHNMIQCDIPQAVNFFSHTASNFFVPYLETSYQDVIRDERADFYLDMPRRIYFYMNFGYGKPTNLNWKKEQKPVCTITGTKETGEDFVETPEVFQSTKGVYYVDLELSSEDFAPNRMLFDEWSNLSFYDCNKEKEVTVKPKTLEFTTKDPDDLYSYGDNDFQPKKYSVSCSGIKYGEKCKRTDGRRRLMFEFTIPYTHSQQVLLDSATCMLYIKDGYNTVIDVWKDYQPIHKTFNANYIDIDLQSYLPNKYFLDVLTVSNNELVRHTEVLYWEIVNETSGGHYK